MNREGKSFAQKEGAGRSELKRKERGRIDTPSECLCHRRGPFSSRSTTKARRKAKEKNTILKCEPWRKIPSEEKEDAGGGGEEEEDDDDENMQRESNRTRKTSNSAKQSPVCEGRVKN